MTNAGAGAGDPAGLRIGAPHAKHCGDAAGRKASTVTATNVQCQEFAYFLASLAFIFRPCNLGHDDASRRELCSLHGT